MNRIAVLCVNLLTAIAFSFATSICIFAAPQDAAVAAPNTDAPEIQVKNESPERYLITLAQYQLKDLSTVDQTSNGILAAIKAQKASPFETVILLATAGYESRVNFGRRIRVTTGKTTTHSGGVVRNTQEIDVGAILVVTLLPDDDKVKAELSFKSTRLDGEGTDDSPPELTTTSIESSQIFEVGKPTLIAASTEGASNFVFLTIARQ